MRLPWTAWEKTLRRLGLRLAKKTRRPEYKTLHPHLEQLESREMMAVEVTNFQLVHDTGASNTDRVTSDPSVSATLGGFWSGMQAGLQFDHNGDGIADGSVTSYTMGSTVTYDPRMTQPSLSTFNGSFDLRYRTLEYNSMMQVIATGSWTTFAMTLDHPPQVEIEVVDSWLNVIADNVGSYSFGSTTFGTPVDKTLTIRNLDVGTLTIDVNSFTLPSGFSLVTPPAASVGPNSSTNFTVRQTAAAAGVFSGTLSFSNNDADENPYNFTLSGSVTLDGPEIQVLDQDGSTNLADGSNYSLGTTNQGQPVTRTLKIVNLGGSPLHLSEMSVPAGVTLISAFANTVSPQGGYTNLTFRFDAPNAGSYSGVLSFTTDDTDENPFNLTLQATVNGGGGSGNATIDGLHLTRDSGLSDTDLATCDPRLSGTVNGSFPNQSVDVEFDHNGDNIKDGFVQVISSGTAFIYDPRLTDASLATYVGAVNFQYRPVVRSASGNVLMTGAWQPFAFTMIAGPGAGGITFAELELSRDTGVSGTDRVTTDPHLYFVLGGTFGSTRALVEFDRDGDGITEESFLVTSAGSEFGYDPRRTDSTLVGYLGSVAVFYRLSQLDATYHVLATGGWDSFRFTLDAPPASQLNLQDLALVNDTGDSATDKITTDPTVKGQVGGTPAAGSSSMAPLPVVEFDRNADGIVDGSVTVDSDKKFRLTPNLASYGATSLKLRVREWNSAYSAATYTPWFTFDLTYVTVGAPAVTALALKSDTGTSATDKITRDPTLTGRLAGSNAGFFSIHVDLNGDDQDDASGYTDQQGNFTVTPQGLAAGNVTARVRSSQYDSKAQGDVFGPWSSLAFTFEVTPIPTVTDLGLVRDTGESSTDKITTDPTVRGKLIGDTNLAGVSVEFDHNGDGTVDGYASTDGLGSFAYRPLGLGLGQQTLRVRSSQWDANLVAYVHSSWASFTFTIEAAPYVAASMGALSLYRDTGSSNTDLVTTEGAIVGNVYLSTAVAGTPLTGFAYITVEIDTNGDGVAELRTQTDASGQFRYVPLNQSPGTYTIRARTKEWDYTNRQGHYGAWSSITYTQVAPVNSPPQLATFTLLADTGVSQSDGVTANPMVTGSVVNDGGNAQLVVEFDHDGDGVGDGLAFTDDQGVFHYTPEPLSFGPVTLRARPLEWDEASGSYLLGNWGILSFTYEQQTHAAPLLTSLALAVGSTTGTSDPTLRGTVIHESALGGITVEFDFSGDGVPDQFTQTNAYGQFRLTPTALPFGTVNVQARAREINPVNGQVLFSSWITCAFTYNQAVNAAPTLAGLSLKNDDGASSTDGITSDPTLQGQVANDGALGGLTIQIDTNGDGIPEGATTTDAQGNFSYRPSGLAFGAQTLRARAKETDSANGGSLYSAWLTIQFTLVDPLASSVHVSSLVLTSDTGNSSTDGSTANPGLSGHVANAPSGGVTVEFDLNGDGLIDGTAQTNSSGDFSFVPPANLQEGYITAKARVASSLPLSAPGFRDPGLTLSFVYGSQPDGAEAQALVSAFHNFNTSWHAAQTGYANASQAADLAYRQSTMATQNTYESTLTAARQTQRATINSANLVYNGIVAGANGIYVSSLQSAHSQFTTDLANFQGNTASLRLKNFELPDKPVTFAAVIPADKDQPLPPADAPVYTGQSYDYAQDKQYQEAQALADNNYAVRSRQIETAYSTRKGEIQSAYTTGINAAKTKFNTDVENARQAYELALKTGVNPVNKNQEEFLRQSAVDEAGRKYARALDRSSSDYTAKLSTFNFEKTAELAAATAWYNSQEPLIWQKPEYQQYYAQHFAWPPEALQDVKNLAEGLAQRQADAEYHLVEKTAGALRQMTDRNAQAEFVKNGETNSANQAYDLKISAYEHWEAVREINAAQVREAAVALAVKERDVEFAKQARIRLVDLAQAAKVHDTDLEAAAGERTAAKAQAAQTPIEARAADDPTPWWTQQKELITHSVTYVTNLVTKVITQFNSDAESERDEISTIAMKQETLAAQTAELRRAQAVDDSQSWKTFRLAANDHQRTLADQEAGLNFAHMEKRAIADQTFATTQSGKVEVQAVALAGSAKTQAYDNAAAVAHTSNEANKNYLIKVATKAAALRTATIVNTFTRDIVTANETRSLAGTLAQQDYELPLHTRQKEREDADTDSYALYDKAVATHAETFARGFAAKYATYLTDASAKAKETANEQNQSQKTLTDEESQLDKTRQENNAGSTQSFFSAAAGLYKTALQGWNTAVNTPWTRLHVANAQAEQDRADDQGLSLVNYVAGAGVVTLGYFSQLSGIGLTLANGIADALDTENSTLAAAVKKYAEDVAQKRREFAHTLAEATADHDKDVAGRDKVFKDQLTVRQKTRDDAVDAAQWDYEREVADEVKILAEAIAGYDFDEATGALTSAAADNWRAAATATKNQMVAVHESGRKSAVAAAEAARVNGNATDFSSWRADVGQKNVDFAADAKAAIDGLASDLKTLEDQLTTDQANAAKALAAQLASAATTSENDDAQAQADYGNNLAPVAGTRDLDEVNSDNAFREKLIHNRGVQENEVRQIHSTKMLAASAPAGAMQNLQVFQRASAQEDVVWSTSRGQAIDGYQQLLSTIYAQQSQGMGGVNGARTELIQSQGAAGISSTAARAAADSALEIGITNKLADLSIESESAATKALRDGIKTSTEYDLTRIAAEKAYNDALAAANVVWTGKWVDIQVAIYVGTAIPHVPATYQNPQGTTDESNREGRIAAAQAAIEAEYQAATNAAQSNFASQVGDGQVTRATEAGDEIVTLATEQKNAQIGFVSGSNGISAAYDAAITAQSVVAAGELGTSYVNYNNRLASLRQQMVAAIGAANVQRSHNLERFHVGSSAIWVSSVGWGISRR